MQQAGIAQFTHLVAGEAYARIRAAIHAVHGFRQRHREVGYAERMSGGCGVARFNGGYGSADKAFKQARDGVIQLAVFQGHGGLSGKGLNNFLLARRVSQYLVLNGIMRIEPRGKITLGIDELKHRNDFFLLVADGHSQNRFGAIARIFIELAVDGIRNVWREMIGVFNVDDFTRQRDIACNGFFINADGGFAEGNGDGIILRQLKPQLLLRRLRRYGRSGLPGGYSSD